MSTVALGLLLGFVVALILGGSQAISRSLFATMVPANRSAEFFGFYAVSGKFASIFGPLVFAVISDIHSNLEALTEVLADIDASRPDAVFCLGDCIGYGAEPERVIQTLRQRGIPSTRASMRLRYSTPPVPPVPRLNPITRSTVVTWLNRQRRK